jgi:hypothetical protein
VKDKQQQKKQTMNGATNEQQKDEKPGFWKRVKKLDQCKLG